VTASRPLRLFLLAGEASGDRLGAALMAGLKHLAGEGGVVFAGVGGEGMAAQGLGSLFPMQDLSVMGLAEVLPRAPLLLRRVRETAGAVCGFAPDALVTIDVPDFSLRVAQRVRAARPDLRMVHYVAPSVWAWRPGRAARMARVIDHVLALLPFEPPYMTDAGMTCDFVGHPVVAEPVSGPADALAFRARHGIAATDPLLLLLPGSRRGEIDRLSPVFVACARRLLGRRPGLRLACVPAPGLADDLRQHLAGLPVVFADGETGRRGAFAAADVALAASGTVSLELAAAGTPHVVAYAANPVTAFLARRMVRVKSPTLVNLLTDSWAVPDFLFGDCTPDRIVPAVQALLDDPQARRDQKAAFGRAMDLLGRGGEAPGLRAARSVLSVIR
jgi:lipid-A-disaccharide synthase